MGDKHTRTSANLQVSLIARSANLTVNFLFSLSPMCVHITIVVWCLGQKSNEDGVAQNNVV